MTKTKHTTTTTQTMKRAFPTLSKDENGAFQAEVEPGAQFTALMGTRSQEAASGIFTTAITALGVSAEQFCSMASAMFAELEPNDAIEAMLIAQMTATHVAMTTLVERMSYQENYPVRESYERSTTRLSRTYLAQMDALKKYRA
ncbi:MAG: hypothetical protein ABJQ34_10560, partial [Paracoccaceae bacterium]